MKAKEEILEIIKGQSKKSQRDWEERCEHK